MQALIPDGIEKRMPKLTKVQRDVSGLAKLFMYKFYAESKSGSVGDTVKAEVQKYPAYVQKAPFVVKTDENLISSLELIF